MSEKIIGYINSLERSELSVLESNIQCRTIFGFKFINELNLYNYPESVSVRNDIVQFVISDSIDLDNATILLNEYDYDPDDESESEFQKQFPPLLKDRVFEITKIIKLLLNSKSVHELGVSLSFCDEIECVKYSSVDLFENTVVADCLESCPPNILYVIDSL